MFSKIAKTWKGQLDFDRAKMPQKCWLFYSIVIQSSSSLETTLVTLTPAGKRLNGDGIFPLPLAAVFALCGRFFVAILLMAAANGELEAAGFLLRTGGGSPTMADEPPPPPVLARLTAILLTGLLLAGDLPGEKYQEWITALFQGKRTKKKLFFDPQYQLTFQSHNLSKILIQTLTIQAIPLKIPVPAFDLCLTAILLTLPLLAAGPRFTRIIFTPPAGLGLPLKRNEW